MEGVETGLFGDITMVVACDVDHHLVILLTSASQFSCSLSVLVLYLSSINRGADNWDKCKLEFCDIFWNGPCGGSALADGDTVFLEIHDCLLQSTSGGVDWGQPSSVPATDNALEHGFFSSYGTCNRTGKKYAWVVEMVEMIHEQLLLAAAGPIPLQNL